MALPIVLALIAVLRDDFAGSCAATESAAIAVIYRALVANVHRLLSLVSMPTIESTAIVVFCSPQHVLFCIVMQDVAIPFMLSPSWEKDTLFLIFEEDFRFEREAPELIPDIISVGQLREAGDVDGSDMRAAEDPFQFNPKDIRQCISCSLMFSSTLVLSPSAFCDLVMSIS